MFNDPTIWLGILAVGIGFFLLGRSFSSKSITEIKYVNPPWTATQTSATPLNNIYPNNQDPRYSGSPTIANSRTYNDRDYAIHRAYPMQELRPGVIWRNQAVPTGRVVHATPAGNVQTTNGNGSLSPLVAAGLGAAAGYAASSYMNQQRGENDPVSPSRYDDAAQNDGAPQGYNGPSTAMYADDQYETPA